MSDCRLSSPRGRRAAGRWGLTGRLLGRAVTGTSDEPDRGADANPKDDADSVDEAADRTSGSSDRANEADRALGARISVPPDDAIGGRPERQVLVVGETAVGLTLALLLRRAGYDPLVASSDAEPSRSGVTYLPPATLAVLAAVDAAAAVRERGVAVDGVSVRQNDTEAATDAAVPGGLDGVETPPVLVRTRALRRALDARRPARQRDDGTRVAALSPRDDGVAVEFDDGVVEWFDAVVDARGVDAAGHLPDRPRPDRAALVQYETPAPLPADTPGENWTLDRWDSGTVVQRLPRPDGGGGMVRVTAPDPEREDESIAGRREAPLPDATGLATALDGVEPTTVRQARLPERSPDPRWWGSDRVAACGAAAWPVAPATGFRIPLGVEDALAFVRAVARADRPASAVVDAYATSRARRLATLSRTAAAVESDHGYPVPDAAESPLATAALLRTVALGFALSDSLSALQRDGVR
ncbi:hypothetical protein HZS55_08075 [Halosimplex rubrum]|uniref:FAD-binding domain-containing protein n=1 Tax=Halosimplex rubrum TaxID=869889 RepID=A0A7D5T4T1_9EURY|nr:FAD-dependent monooxygenase [Halosimplex rubrum]QLH77249.1 hypothetical protein HZS55_08075 [Halosimplex rubrum]